MCWSFLDVLSLGSNWLLYPVTRVILESDPQQVLQKVSYRVRWLSVISNYQLYQLGYFTESLQNQMKKNNNQLYLWNMCSCSACTEWLHQDSCRSFLQLFSLTPCLLLTVLLFSLSFSDWCQLMSEPAYGFVLFDYITGNLEGQADKSQQL